MEEVEFGVEVYFFNSCIYLEGIYYDCVINDQIFQVLVVGFLGVVFCLVNVGSMQNEGVEVFLEVILVKICFFQWDIGGMFIRNRNCVKLFIDGVDNICLGGFINLGIYIVCNEGYGVIWGLQYECNDQG